VSALALGLVVAIAVLLLLCVAAGSTLARRRAVARREREPQAPPHPPPGAPTPGGLVEAPAEAPAEALAESPSEAPAEAPAEAAEAPSFRARMAKARQLLSGYLGPVTSRSRIEEATWEELEEALIRADVGVVTTAKLLEELRERVRSGSVGTPEELLEELKSRIEAMLGRGDRSLHMAPAGTTSVWLFVGVNGAGKTTTIGKVATREAAAGRKVVMAAGDTFRAAASEQLEVWAQKVGSDMVKGAEGSDPGAVVFDAVQKAAARGGDLVLADTAGRLHTKVNLMEELRKVRRVADRPPGSVCEVLLVIDATTGQNGLAQARQFAEAVGVTGVVLTKLDGTAKGGIVVAIVSELGIPVKLVGLGESPEDLVDMDPEQFVEALLGQ
jgi:fused signal recognition particle receptor